jgi:hypothetical protein
VTILLHKPIGIGQDSSVEKEYLVRVEGSLSEDGLRRLRHGKGLDLVGGQEVPGAGVAVGAAAGWGNFPIFGDWFARRARRQFNNVAHGACLIFPDKEHL